MRRFVSCAMGVALTVGVVAAPAQAAKKRKPKKPTKTVFVCKKRSECRIHSLQQGVDAVAPGGTVKVRPGVYSGGVLVRGHAKDGIRIVGTGDDPSDVILEGKDVQGTAGQNGVFVDGANNVTIENMTARNFAANGFFARNCDGYLMRKLVAAYNRAYGLYAFNCIGGRMTQSVGYGHADSAFYVGQTPVQQQPKKTILDHLEAYLNVLGYSGTNSRYVEIRFSEFYNNGAGIAPNTLDSEKFEPAEQNLITENLIYWNNFNYYKPDSPVKPLPSAVGSFNYPIGVGVLLFGVKGTVVRNNLIFGNFKWGAAAFSDPTNSDATTVGNRFLFNNMGAAFNDANGVDFFYDGTGSGNCFENNSAGATFDAGSVPNAVLYPACGSGSPPANVQDPVQVAELGAYAVQKQEQENSWSKHPHPARPDRKPIDGQEG